MIGGQNSPGLDLDYYSRARFATHGACDGLLQRRSRAVLRLYRTGKKKHDETHCSERSPSFLVPHIVILAGAHPEDVDYDATRTIRPRAPDGFITSTCARGASARGMDCAITGRSVPFSSPAPRA